LKKPSREAGQDIEPLLRRVLTEPDDELLGYAVMVAVDCPHAGEVQYRTITSDEEATGILLKGLRAQLEGTARNLRKGLL
jgi:hypothetical protein